MTNEPKWWTKFKEECVSSLSKLFVWGGTILFAWAVWYAYIGKTEMNEMSETLNAKVTNYANDGVSRDAEIIQDMSRLEDQVRQMRLEIRALIEALKNKKPLKIQDPPRKTRIDKGDAFKYIQRHKKEYQPIYEQRAR